MFSTAASSSSSSLPLGTTAVLTLNLGIYIIMTIASGSSGLLTLAPSPQLINEYAISASNVVIHCNPSPSLSQQNLFEHILTMSLMHLDLYEIGDWRYVLYYSLQLLCARQPHTHRLQHAISATTRAHPRDPVRHITISAHIYLLLHLFQPSVPTFGVYVFLDHSLAQLAGDRLCGVQRSALFICCKNPLSPLLSPLFSLPYV